MNRIMLIIILLSILVFVACEKEKCNALWCVEIGGSAGQPVLGDVDGDGMVDVVVSSSDGNIFALRGTDGFKMWSFQTGARSIIALGNINNDKGLEIFADSYYSDIYALNGKDGTLLWSFPSFSKKGWCTELSLGDLNGDGELEAIFSSSSPNIDDSGLYVLNGKDGSLLWSFKPAAGLFSIGALGDLNGDSKLDVIMTFLKWVYFSPFFSSLINREDIRSFNSTNYDDGLYALNGEDGSVLWYNSSIFLDNCDSSLGDVDGDGKLEIVYRDYTLSGEDGSVLLQNSLSCVGASLGDVDNDGGLELVSIDYQPDSDLNEVLVLNGKNGSLLWKYSLEKDYPFTPPSLGDVDGDAKLEVVFSHGNKIIILNGEDGSPQSFYELSGNLSSPLLGDVNGDGIIEIVVGSTNGTVYAISTGSPAPIPDLLPWPMERHDPYRTGNYNFVPGELQ